MPTSNRQILSLALASATNSLQSALSLANSAQREVEHLTSLLEALSPSFAAVPASPSPPSRVTISSFPSYRPLYLSARSLRDSHPLFASGFLRLGDFVQIAFPKGTQQSQGIACDSQGQFCVVRTSHGQ